MASMIRKLIVEVIEARDLLPKDGMGTSSPYLVVDFDGQRKRTQTIHRNLNPTWNEVLEFKVNGNSLNMAGEPLEVNVLHDRKVGPSRRNNFLGRVKIDSRHFVRKGEEALVYFPLEKKSIFGWVRGDIGLRIYYVDQPEIVPEPSPLPPEPPAEAPTKTEEPAAEANLAAEAKTEGDASPTEQQPTEAPIEVEAKQEESPKEDDSKAVEALPETAEIKPQPPTESLTGKAKVPEAPPLQAPTEQGADPKWVPPPPLAQVIPEPTEKSNYDLVDKMYYLFVRVVRARSLPGDAKPHVRIEALGRHISTKTARRGAFFEWDATFAFARRLSSAAADSSTLEVSVWDLPPASDVTTSVAGDKHFLGGVCFDVPEVPMRDPPDSPLALQWYRLEGSGARNGDLMLATWVGTQADESFPDAVKVDDVKNSNISSRSKIYLSPKLWYLRATIIEANDTTIGVSRGKGISVKASLGFQILKTRPAFSSNGTPSWNEDLILVAADPLGDDKIIFTLEVRHNKDTMVIGTAGIDLSSIERRVDDRKVTSRWLDLTPSDEIKKGVKRNASTGAGRLHVRVCLDGGYHVADEPPESASDFRPSARQLWRSPIGVIELGIIGCKNLLPMKAVDGKGSTDSYAVAKYGPKWTRTRTVPDSFNPSWNEQYTWPVYDPCTTLTVGVFDECCNGSKEPTSHPMGKVRIRISNLETNRSYRCSYPLTLLLPSGAKKMGEIEIAVRFSRAVTSLDLLHMYGKPMLPSMHHIRPISAVQRDPLRLAAAQTVAGHLSRSEPSLSKEVVTWMLDATDARGFSMRKVRANYHRIMISLSWISGAARWMEETRAWRNPMSTMIVHVVMVLLIWFPELVIPSLALHVFGVGLWRYRYRVRVPEAGPSIRISGADTVDRDELDEEFDPIPSTRAADVVRARYDRARVMGARVQALLGDVAAQAERVQSLVTWRDPRATGMFLAACIAVAVILYVVPSKVVAVVAGFHWLRHPMFRDRMPAPAMNFFRRLPALSDRII